MHILNKMNIFIHFDYKSTKSACFIIYFITIHFIAVQKYPNVILSYLILLSHTRTLTILTQSILKLENALLLLDENLEIVENTKSKLGQKKGPIAEKIDKKCVRKKCRAKSYVYDT